MFVLESLIRQNIKNLVPYSSARDEYKGNIGIFLDANENAYGSVSGNNLNRYPDPLQKKFKAKLSQLKNIDESKIFVGNGSDEAIDLIYRIFCNPSVDNAIVCPPTYGMYEVAAQLNDVKVQKINLTTDYQLNVNEISAGINQNTKLIFICSPNNPTANLMNKEDIIQIINNFNGIVVIDEAYIDFASEAGFVPELDKYQNLIILQTLSKAWGMAGIRVGLAFASPQIIEYFNKAKPPYNVNVVSQKFALEALENEVIKKHWVEKILLQRNFLIEKLENLSYVKTIYPTDANFILIKTVDANKIYNYLVEGQIIVRNRNSVVLCENCLRITVGTENENVELIKNLQELDNHFKTNKNFNFSPQKFEDTKSIQRKSFTERKTKETDIFVEVNLDGKGVTEIFTGIGFFDHMLDQIGRHSGINLIVKAIGDLSVDEHHTIEDVGIALGQTIKNALGNKQGIERYGFSLPMDDCLAQVSLDFGGRNWLVWETEFKREKVGEMPTEMFYHFFKSFSDEARCNLNIKAEGTNEHHKIEAIFKAFAKSLKMAVKRDENNMQLPSTKGIL